MSSWQRTGKFGTTRLEPTQLLAHQVVLNQRDWYTMYRPGSIHAEARRGVDCGTSVQLNPALRMRMDNILVFQSYVVERRAMSQLFCGVFDSNDMPVFAERGQTYHPREMEASDFGRLGEKYVMVISFASKQEAMAYRLMIEGID